MQDKTPSRDPGQAFSRAAAGLIPSHRILVADDDKGVRLLIARQLQEAGYHVDSAEDGAVAWSMLQVSDYDLLVTDHNMPYVTGIELVRKLRSARKALVVVLISGLMPAAELKLQPSLNLAATLEKPFTGDELTAIVGHALQAGGVSGPPTTDHPVPHRGLTQSRTARLQA